MAYVKTNWQDGQTYGQDSFNNIENGIANNDARLTRIENGDMATIGADRKETDLLNNFMHNLRTVPYDGTDEETIAATQLEICFMGDSVLYGYMHMDDPSGIEEDCITDDGDSYRVRFGKTPKRNSLRIHNGVINGLNAVYGANKVKPKLKLYSGYCAKWGYQHYYASNSDLIIINYGINDAIASWVNDDDNYQGDIRAYTKYMRLIIERELNNGTAVVLMTPTRQTMMFDHAGGSDNDPDDTNNRTAIDAYEQALKQLAQEYGCPIIDGNELTRNLSMDAFIDFTHFTADQNLSIGYRMAAYFIGQSPLYKNEVYSGAYLGVNPQIDNINITGTAQFARATYSPNQPAIMANKNLVYPIPDPDWRTKGLMVNVSGTGSVTWSFYCPHDNMVVIPSVFTKTEGQGVQMQLDFGGLQGKPNNHWNLVMPTITPDYTYEEPTSVVIPGDEFKRLHDDSSMTGWAYGLHMFDYDDQPFLLITTKGWHTISIMMPPAVSTFSVPDTPVGDGNFDVFGLNFMTLREWQFTTTAREEEE